MASDDRTLMGDMLLSPAMDLDASRVADSTRGTPVEAPDGTPAPSRGEPHRPTASEGAMEAMKLAARAKERSDEFLSSLLDGEHEHQPPPTQPTGGRGETAPAPASSQERHLHAIFLDTAAAQTRAHYQPSPPAKDTPKRRRPATARARLEHSGPRREQEGTQWAPPPPAPAMAAPSPEWLRHEGGEDIKLVEVGDIVDVRGLRIVREVISWGPGGHLDTDIGVWAIPEGDAGELESPRGVGVIQAPPPSSNPHRPKGASDALMPSPRGPGLAVQADATPDSPLGADMASPKPSDASWAVVRTPGTPRQVEEAGFLRTASPLTESPRRQFSSEEVPALGASPPPRMQHLTVTLPGADGPRHHESASPSPLRSPSPPPPRAMFHPRGAAALAIPPSPATPRGHLASPSPHPPLSGRPHSASTQGHSGTPRRPLSAHVPHSSPSHNPWGHHEDQPAPRSLVHQHRVPKLWGTSSGGGTTPRATSPAASSRKGRPFSPAASSRKGRPFSPQSPRSAASLALSATMSSRHDAPRGMWEAPYSPGPSQYDTRGLSRLGKHTYSVAGSEGTVSGRTASIGIGPKLAMCGGGVSKVPGPGSYNVRAAHAFLEAPSGGAWSGGQAREPHKIGLLPSAKSFQEPGPASYSPRHLREMDSKSSWGSYNLSGGYSFGASKKASGATRTYAEQQARLQPGPGAYRPNGSFKGVSQPPERATYFGAGERWTCVPSGDTKSRFEMSFPSPRHMPGPGAHNLDRSLTPRHLKDVPGPRLPPPSTQEHAEAMERIRAARHPPPSTRYGGGSGNDDTFGRPRTGHEIGARLNSPSLAKQPPRLPAKGTTLSQDRFASMPGPGGYDARTGKEFGSRNGSRGHSFGRGATRDSKVTPIKYDRDVYTPGPPKPDPPGTYRPQSAR